MAGRSIVYRSAPGIAWVKDAELTLIVDDERGQSWSLRGLEAAVWDLMTLSHSFAEIVNLVSLLAHCAPDEAASIVTALLHQWEQQGIVRATEGSEGE